jgi:hypothetical protein
MIYKLVTKFRATGSVLDKKKKEKKRKKKLKKKRHILTEKKLDEIGARLEASPKKSLCQLALQCGVSKSAAHI